MRQGYEMRPTCFTRGSLLSDLHLLSTLLAHQMSVQSGTNVAATNLSLGSDRSGHGLLLLLCYCWQRLLWVAKIAPDPVTLCAFIVFIEG